MRSPVAIHCDGLALFFYNLLLLALSPLLALFYWYRLSRGKEDRTHWRERWGRYPESLAGDTRRPRFWVHAVSVGETMAAVPILRELRARHPDALIVLTVTTVGAREVAQSKIPPADFVVYFPLDFPMVVGQALRALRPDALILMEWEIWPNLLAQAQNQGATVAVVNGRISDKGLRRGLRARALLQPGLDAVALFAMQSEEDARRAPLVGAAPDRVRVTGNTKFDESARMLSGEERVALRREFGIPEDALVFICGSTRDGSGDGEPDEEQIIGTVLAFYRAAPPGGQRLTTILAPRHLERAARVQELLEASGLKVRRRSAGPVGAGESFDVLLLDTFGELARAYAVAAVAFVGGSLVKRGGQSVFQPLAQGVPTVFGPYMNNQRDIAALAQAEGVGFLVQDGAELAATVKRLLTLSAPEKATLAAKCRALIERNQGVTARTLDALDDLLRRKGTPVA